MSAEDRKVRPLLLCRKFTVTTSVKTDPVQWNKEWDKGLHPLSAKDVYAELSPIWTLDKLDPVHYAEILKGRVLLMQNLMAKSWAEMEEDRKFVTAWLLLAQCDRQTHLLKGMEVACMDSSLGGDARAMCPDIKISSMLKRHGRAYVDFLSRFTKEKKAVGENDIYQFPSQWWEEAVDQSNTLFALLTIQRNEFISESIDILPIFDLPQRPAQFLLHSLTSIAGDLAKGSGSMDPVLSILRSDIGNSVGRLVHGIRDKPLIRCEKCTKTPEEIGENIKFRLCSICKAKLDFAVYYCSQYVSLHDFSSLQLKWRRECQKADWREHKKICGKQQSTKSLPGTIRDHFWQHTFLPDFIRNVPAHPAKGVHITSTGFGTPHPSRPHSPALQRQMSLLTGDKYVDYFLFDELDHPVRFEIRDMNTKLIFRSIRSAVLTSPTPIGLAPIAEYLIKMMEHKPGLSRQRILAQLSREHSEDVAEMVAMLEQSPAKAGHPPGTTYMEVTCKSISNVLPRLSNFQ